MMTSRLRGLLGVLGAVLLITGFVLYGLHAFGFWKKPPESENAKRHQYKQYQTIPNPQGGGYIEVEIRSQNDLEQNSISQRQLLTIVLPLCGIGIVLLMIYGFTAPAKPLPRHHQSTLNFKDPFSQ